MAKFFIPLFSMISTSRDGTSSSYRRVSTIYGPFEDDETLKKGIDDCKKEVSTSVNSFLVINGEVIANDSDQGKNIEESHKKG